MTNQPMTCDGVADQLASYLEDELPAPTRLALEAHAASCVACGSLLADLDAIRCEAAALPTLEPSHDLWSGIAARIDAPVVTLDEARRARTAGARRTWLRPSVAAAALILVTAGVTHYFTRASIESNNLATGRGQPPLVAQVGTPAITKPAGPITDSLGTLATSASERGSSTATGTTPSTNPVARLASAVPVMKETQPVYDQEIGKLRAIVKERRSQLDPNTVAVLEQSIAVIDSAIAQSRAALAKDPASGFLATQLNHSLEKKVELLRTAALLPSRT